MEKVDNLETLKEVVWKLEEIAAEVKRWVRMFTCSTSARAGRQPIDPQLAVLMRPMVWSFSIYSSARRFTEYGVAFRENAELLGNSRLS